MKYRPEIDGLRAIAVLFVFVFHLNPEILPSGFIGVDLFFVISGYLITGIILNQQESGNWSLRIYYIKRIKRIVPLLFLTILFFTIISCFIFTPTQLVKIAQNSFYGITFISNVFFYFESGYFQAIHSMNLFLHTWSISIEMQFYLLYPLLLLVINRFLRGSLGGWIAFFAVLSFVMAQWGGNGTVRYPFIEKELFLTNVADWAYFMPFTRAWVILLGALVFLIEKSKLRLLYANQITIASLFLLILPLSYIGPETPYPSAHALLPTLSFCLLILCLRKGQVAYSVLTWSPLQLIGKISFSIYLIHYPLIKIFNYLRWDGIVEMVAIVIITFFASLFTWKYVEQRYRKKASGRFISMLLIANLIPISALVSSNGFIDEYDGHDKYLAGNDHKGEGELSSEFYKQFNLSPFSLDDSRQKLLVIGDSYAEDFVNSLRQNQLDANVQLSTFKIPASCGNLMVESDITPFIPKKLLPMCCNVGWYSSPDLLDLIEKADVVLLASLWREWQMPFLQESLSNIQGIATGKVFVFGAKDFGEINLRELLQIPYPKRLTHLNSLSNQSIKVNEKMRNNIPEDQFIDFQQVMGSSEDLVPIFTPEGILISQDGQHSTNAGARYIGQRLLQSHPALKSLLVK